MSVAFIVSLAGVDRPNLIQELAEHTHELEGKWINSRVNYLDGHIAANIKIEAPAENKTAIVDYFSKQEKITSYIEDLELGDTIPAETVALSIKATDRSGLVADITNIINQRKTELVHMENHRFSVQPLGTNVFTADLTVRIQQDDHIEDLIQKLKTIGSNIIITVEEKESED